MGVHGHLWACARRTSRAPRSIGRPATPHPYPPTPTPHRIATPPQAVTDQDAGDTVTVTVVNSTQFAVSGASSLVVAPGATVDYEAALRGSPTATIAVALLLRDAGVGGVSAAVPVTLFVRVVDAADPPRFAPSAPAVVTVSEATAGGAALAPAFTAVDDDGDALVYAVAAVPADPRFEFGVNGSGAVLLPPGGLDFEAVPAFTVTVTATEARPGGLSASRTFGVTVTDANDAPGALGCSAACFTWLARPGVNLVKFLSGPTVNSMVAGTWSLSASATPAQCAALCAAQPGCAAYTSFATFYPLVAWRGYCIGASAAAAVPVDEGFTPGSVTSGVQSACCLRTAVPESAGPGAVAPAAVLAALDQEGHAVSWAVGPSALFALQPVPLPGFPAAPNMTLALAGALDFESAPTVVATLVLVDAGSPPANTTLLWVIDVVDVNEPPVFDTPPGAVVSVVQGSQPLSSVGPPQTASDPEGTPVVYTLSGHSEALSINATTGVLFVTAVFARVAGYTFNVTVTASSGGLTSSRVVTVVTVGGNSPPVFVAQARALPETARAGAAVGAPLAVTDFENDTVVFAIVGATPAVAVGYFRCAREWACRSLARTPARPPSPTSPPAQCVGCAVGCGLARGGVLLLLWV
jgi:hypothetical protein